MFLYETHCHTAPVSKCGKASAEDTVRFYKKMGYDGVFITNHFLAGNINPEVWNLPYEGQIDYYFSDLSDYIEIHKQRFGVVIRQAAFLPSMKKTKTI